MAVVVSTVTVDEKRGCQSVVEIDKFQCVNPLKSEVIGRCGGDEKKPNDHAERQKSNAKKIKMCESLSDFIDIGTHIANKLITG